MKNASFLIIILTLLFLGCQKEEENILFEENECLVQIGEEWELVILDQIPEYIDGGKDGFTHNSLEEIKYPPEARENGIEGNALVQYEITIEGMVENIIIIQNPGAGIGEEVKRVIELITDGVSFTPAQLDTNLVRVRKEFKAKFSLK